jgi:hypothetical protein
VDVGNDGDSACGLELGGFIFQNRAQMVW